jgi:hypothetical protein
MITFKIIIVRRVLQLRRVGNEEVFEATTRLNKLGYRLSMNRALKLFVEISESIGCFFLFALPCFILRAEATFDEHRLTDLFDSKISASFLLLLPTPFF